MRIISILTALPVLSGLYFLVFERDAVRAVSIDAPLSTLLFGVTQTDSAGSHDTALDVDPTNDETNFQPQAVKVVALQSMAYGLVTV
jgi:hypothetical protein